VPKPDARLPARAASVAALVVTAAVAVVLTGCSATSSGAGAADDGVVRVVASTDVYGDIAETIAGPDVEVTSLIDRADQDPHEYTASGRDQLALSRADIVIVNGGGYDDFVTTMLAASGNTTARVIDAVKLSGYDASAAGFNEHVFYDYPTMTTVATALNAALDIADPSETAAFDGRAKAFEAQLTALEQLESSMTSVVSGAGVIVTEPVPLYVLNACGFQNLTPQKFSAAIEDGHDASPALLQQVLGHISNGSAKVVVYNSQTGGPQTDALLDAAKAAHVPTIGVTETLPEKQHYLDWQRGLLTDLLKAAAP